MMRSKHFKISNLRSRLDNMTVGDSEILLVNEESAIDKAMKLITATEARLKGKFAQRGMKCVSITGKEVLDAVLVSRLE